MDDATFGVELVLDLFGCAPATLRSRDELARFTRELCELIGMKPYGDLFAERFGLNDAKTAGYSVVQLVETSSITGHFCEQWNSAYLNVFSCRDFDLDAATEFAKAFFAAERVERTVHHR